MLSTEDAKTWEKMEVSLTATLLSYSADWVSSPTHLEKIPISEGLVTLLHIRRVLQKL